MKNTKLITLFTALFVGIIMISCGKYEEGPGFSLLPKKTRLQQNWNQCKLLTPMALTI